MKVHEGKNRGGRFLKHRAAAGRFTMREVDDPGQPRLGRDVGRDSLEGELGTCAVDAVWDTIWLVARLPGMAESFDELLQYGELVACGAPCQVAAALVIEMVDDSSRSSAFRAGSRHGAAVV